MAIVGPAERRSSGCAVPWLGDEAVLVEAFDPPAFLRKSRFRFFAMTPTVAPKMNDRRWSRIPIAGYIRVLTVTGGAGIIPTTVRLLNREEVVFVSSE